MTRKRKAGTAVFIAAVLFAVGCGSTGTGANLSGSSDQTASLSTASDTTGNTASDTTGSGTNQDGEPAWSSLAKDGPVTLNWYVNFSWFTTEWGNSLVAKKITDDTGVTINFEEPKGNESEKLNAMITSDSLPDIITLGWWEPQVDRMIDDKMVYAINELADQYDPYFFKAADSDTIEFYTKEDGNLYCYPNSSVTPQDVEEHPEIGSNETFLVRKDIYEAIGSPDMTTQEGFLNAVRKAKEMFPTIDGKPLIPIGAHVFDNQGNVSFDKYLMDFLAVPFEVNNEIYDRVTDPEYLSWLKMYRELCSEGLLTGDVFTDQRAQMDEKLSEGRYFCMLYQYTDVENAEKTLYQNDPDSIYIAIDGPTSSDRKQHTLPANAMNGWTVTMISKNCKHPDRAIALISYLLSEYGQKITYLGLEGQTYDMVDGKAVTKDNVREMMNTDRKEYDRTYGANNTYWMFQNILMQLPWRENLFDPVDKMREWTYPYVIYGGEYYSKLPTGTETAEQDDQITELWSETLPELLLAESDEKFDEIIDSFKTERDTLGFDGVQKAKTEEMLKMKEQLGIS